MSADLRVAAGEYLEQRRARGYKLRDEGALLTAFVDTLHAAGAERITVADAVAFARRGPEVSRATHAWRLGVIRAFASWLRAVDPAAAEDIPPGLIRGGYQRVNPFLYSPAQVPARPGCTPSGTPWRSTPWSMPTAGGSTSTPASRSCPPSWATRTRSTRTGT